MHALRPLAPALPGFVFLFVVLVAPIAILLLRSVTEPEPGLDNYRTLLESTAYLTVLWNTFVVATIVTVVALLISYPVAWFLVVAPRRLAALVFAIVILSMWTSLLARLYAWLVLLQNTGAINKLLIAIGLIDAPIPMVNNLAGVVIGMTYIMIPFMVLPIHTTLSALDPSILRAASVCGAGPVSAFFRVLLPLSVPGISSGCIMVFVMSLGYFIAPAMLGSAREMMIAQLIAQQVQTLLDWGLGGAAAVILLAVTLTIYAGYMSLVGIEKR